MYLYTYTGNLIVLEQAAYTFCIKLTEYVKYRNIQHFRLSSHELNVELGCQQQGDIERVFKV